MKQSLTNLRKVLAHLYSDEPSIRRLLDDSDIDSTRITFGGSAINTWHSILTEANKMEQINNLLSVVKHEYGKNQEFQDAWYNYQQLIGQRGNRDTTKELNTISQGSRPSVDTKNKHNDISIIGLKPGSSTYNDIVNKLGLPLRPNYDKQGNSILEYSNRGLHFVITEYPVKLNSVVDSIFIEHPYNYPLPHSLALNMTMYEAQKICNISYKELYQLRTKNSITYSHEIAGKKYGIVLHFIENILLRIRYCIL